MDRVTKQIIKCKVMLYPRLQKEIAEQIADISETMSSGGIGGGKNTSKELKGWDMALIGVMSKEDYLWCKSIEDTVNYFKERERSEVSEAIDALYWKCNLNADGLSVKLYISRATVYNLVDMFLETVHKFALKNGLLLEV